MLRSSRTLLLTLFATAALCVAPGAAHAGILIGAESNGELANSFNTPADQAVALDKMQAMGVKVVRVNFAWNEIATGTSCPTASLAQLADNTNACYNWGLLDSLVTLTKARRQSMLLSLTRVPSFVNHNANPFWMGATEADFQNVKVNYVAFMTAAGTRYNKSSSIGTIPYWTILNEPGSKDYWKPAPNVKRYAQIYGAAAPALRKAHSTALIGVGPTGPRSRPIHPVPFIREFVKWAPKYLPGSMATKRSYINAWGHNPYPNATNPPRYKTPGAPVTSIGMSQMSRLFFELDKSPLTKGVKVWAAEFGYETAPEPVFRVSPAIQARYQIEAFHWLDSQKRVTIGINYGLTDPKQTYDWQSGMFYANGTKKPLFAAFQRMVSVPVPATDSLARIKGDKFKRNAVIPIWGRSNLLPTKGVLAYRVSKTGVWKKVPGQKRSADGTINAKMKLSAPVMYFSLYDGQYGPMRVIKTR